MFFLPSLRSISHCFFLSVCGARCASRLPHQGLRVDASKVHHLLHRGLHWKVHRGQADCRSGYWRQARCRHGPRPSGRWFTHSNPQGKSGTGSPRKEKSVWGGTSFWPYKSASQKLPGCPAAMPYPLVPPSLSLWLWLLRLFRFQWTLKRLVRSWD